MQQQNELTNRGGSFTSYLNGDWIPHDQMHLQVDDVGFRQGVTAVERLRTYGGRLFATKAHLTRFAKSTATLHIAPVPEPADLTGLMRELLERNDSQLEHEPDIGVTLFATPGVIGRGVPTLGLHLNRLDHQRIAYRQQHGQPLHVTQVRQPDPQSWPRSIKTRSRIHYYLADHEARSLQEDSLAVLLDQDGTITETSTSNLAIVRDGRLLSPPSDRVLPGITQQEVETLAEDAGMEWVRCPITVHDLTSAEELILMGTDGGVWFGKSVNAEPIANGQPGPIFHELKHRYDVLTTSQ